MANCFSCGGPIGLRRRLTGIKQCEACEDRVLADCAMALSQYDAAVQAVVDVGHAGRETARMADLERVIAAAGQPFEPRKVAVFSRFLEQALSDEVLTLAEEQRLNDIGNVLLSDQAMRNALAPYRERLFIAMVNDGRLPTVTSSRQLILKKAELIHLEEPAAVLKEVVNREYQGSSHGMSFKIAKGVYYRVGAQRGHMVEVGRSWQPADTGVLSITSQRLVFSGLRKSIEMPYAKLLALNVYTDGLQVSVSNRQTPTMFRLSSGNIVAAAVNAAMQRLL